MFSAKHFLFPFLSLIAFFALPALVFSETTIPDGRYNLNFLFSFVRLVEGHPDLADNDQEVGLEFDATPRNWPVAIEADLFFGLRERRGSDLGDVSSTSFRAQTFRFGVGPRRYWTISTRSKALPASQMARRPVQISWLAHLAGGPALVYRTVNYGAPRNISDSDLGFGGWISTGLTYSRNRFNLGLEARAYVAELELGNRTGTPWVTMLGVIFGRRF